MKTENRALFRKARATNPVWDELRTAQRGSKDLTVDGFRLTDPQLDSNLTDVEFSDSELDTILPLKVNKNEEELVSGDEVSREFLPSHSGKSDVSLHRTCFSMQENVMPLCLPTKLVM